MDREAMDGLRHDRRLAHRRGWIADKDAQQAEEALPDAAAKGMTLGEATDKVDGGDAAVSPTPPQP